MLDRLDEVLASVGRHLVIDAAAGDAHATSAGVDRSWTRRHLLAVAVIVAVVVGSIASIPPARRAVGGWLHVGPIDVSIDPDVTIEIGLPAFIDDASPIDPTEAPGILGTATPDLASTTLGTPTGWWTVPEGGVVVTWNDSATSMWIMPTAPEERGHVDKHIDASGAVTATRIPDLGNGGIAIDGAHVMQTPHRTVAAGSVVAWDQDGLTFRLESATDIDDLVEVARSMAASRDVES